MKKFIKYSLYGLIYLFIVFILAIIFMNSAKAELVKPNNSIEPYQVVKIQLRGLKNNDEPKKNNGIEQTWEFAHPFNKRYTGPLPKFINMIKSKNYKMLLNHLDSEIIEIFKTDDKYGFEVKILGQDKNYYKKDGLSSLKYQKIKEEIKFENFREGSKFIIKHIKVDF